MSEATNYSEEKCIVCGRIVRFYNAEYKKPCKNCGTWIFEMKNYAQRKNQEKNKPPKCWACMDKGIIEYAVQFSVGIYTFVARCTCPEGLKWPSTIPLLDQCEHAPKFMYLELKNRKLSNKHLMLVNNDVPEGFEPVEVDEKLPF